MQGYEPREVPCILIMAPYFHEATVVLQAEFSAAQVSSGGGEVHPTNDAIAASDTRMHLKERIKQIRHKVYLNIAP